MSAWGKWVLTITGGLVVVYAVAVLGYVSSSPDLRIRCMLADNDLPDESPGEGIAIRSNTGIQYKGNKPERKDLLVRIGRPDSEIRNFNDFSRILFDLRNEPLPTGGLVPTGSDPTEDPHSPYLVEYPNRERAVAVEFRRPGTSERLLSSVIIQSLPQSEVVLSFVWFILQLGVFLFAAAAFWNRPYDRPSRMFFLMCIVTLGAYVGGYHWWIISGRLWLKVPFSICAMLVSPVALHFFLIFPHPKRFVANYPRTSLAVVYLVPGIAVVTSVVLQIQLDRLSSLGTPESGAEVARWLGMFREAIYIYLYIAAAYFLLTLIAVRHSLACTRNPMERGQMQWIWHSGQVAALCVGYTIFLIITDREKFALGGARIPMFLASLSFMLAYSVGILRYRLMVLDQIAGKGLSYYFVSSALTLAFGLIVALGSLLPEVFNLSLTQGQVLALMLILMLAVWLLLWLRDLIQQGIDRQFFREKYQLDKALERVNRAVGHLADPELLAKMMLNSCRDVLSVGHAALYLRTTSGNTFQLAAAENTSAIPMQFTPDSQFLKNLQHFGSLQRVTPGSRSELSPAQNLLRQMQADLVHTLETGAEVVGLVFLGRKKTSASFTAEDLTFLNALGQITNVALHSAKVDRDIARLNEDLRLKSEKIADQKRHIALLQTDLTSTQFSASAREEADVPDREFHRAQLQGNGVAIQKVLATARKVANTDATVLVRGESGTGKELLAEILHENSPRHSGPLVRVHCAALSPGLLESELFGHVKGAFTGANRDRPGRFQVADGGTLFLDEIGEISLETQVKLLRVLQDRSFEPVGGNSTLSVNVRLITATHRHLEKLITDGQFREDLYYRLNVVSLTLPPLRERSEDLCELALYFLNRSAERLGKRIRYIDDDALTALEQYQWPGNVRELENVIERAVVLCEDNRILTSDLPRHIQDVTTAGLSSPRRVRHGISFRPSLSNSPPETDSVIQNPTLLAGVITQQSNIETNEHHARGQQNSDTTEKERLVAALAECEGNKTEAARRLGMPRSTYYSKLKKHGIG